MATVVTVTSNGKLMKPQILENGKLRDWTSSNTTIGSSNKPDRSFAHNYQEELKGDSVEYVFDGKPFYKKENEVLPRVFDRNGKTDDWAKEQVPIRNDKENQNP
jgi:hypothetical protein